MLPVLTWGYPTNERTFIRSAAIVGPHPNLPPRRGGRGSSSCGGLQVLVIRTRAALGRDPGDDLVRVLDVAGLAVHAVGGIDLQALGGPALGPGFLDDLVHAHGAEARARVGVLLDAAGHADAGVEHLQVHRLVFVVLGGGVVDAGQAVARLQAALDVIAPARVVRAVLVQRSSVRT